MQARRLMPCEKLPIANVFLAIPRRQRTVFLSHAEFHDAIIAEIFTTYE